MKMISSGESGSSPNRCRRRNPTTVTPYVHFLHKCSSVSLIAPDGHPVDAVRLGEFHFDHFVEGGRHVFADVIGADRQLPVTAVDDDRQLDPPGAAVIDQRVE